MPKKNHSIDFLLKINILEENIDTEEEKDWIEPRLYALNEDIGNIEGVTVVTFSKFNNIVSIVIKSDLSLKELEAKMKIYLLRDHEYFKPISIKVCN